MLLPSLHYMHAVTFILQKYNLVKRLQFDFHFRFVSLLGKVLSELAVFGKTQYDISAFTMSREAVLNPDFKPSYRTKDISKANV